jgi:predicted nucleic acid-binding protein
VTAAPKLVVDASVAVKWYVPEPGSPAAAALLGGSARLLAPDLLVAEFGNTLWKKTRRGELKGDEGDAIVRAFLGAPPVAFYASTALLQPAWEMARRFRRTVYDALYLALAVAENCPFVTADAALARSIHATPLRDFVVSLTAWTSSRT